ncbi:MAG TPA: SurA N-terminal domain-containing protein [Verrucomicrobiae bacterium]|jgi:hypothetical protein|nr:SurA N-terminal domain-containing protein [Verrucomicrobiae bacterium]
MIGTIRRHQNWLWAIIIAATIISFTAYLSPTTRQSFGGGGGSSDADLGSVNGEAVTRDQYANAEREGDLFFRLRYGEWPTTADQKKAVDRWAEQRLLLDAEMKEYNINVTPEAAARFAKQIFGVPADQPMPLDKFGDFVQNELARKGGLTMDDFNRFVVHQAGQEYLVALFGISGKLITSQEAEFFYRRENTPMVTERVSFTAANYYAKTSPTEKDLQDYYDKHEADYRLPDRIQVNYVFFPASNYFASVDKTIKTNLDERIEQAYLQAGPEAFKDDAGKQLSADDAKAELKKRIRNYDALTDARKDANTFLNELSANHDDQHPYTRDNLRQLAKTKGLTVKTSEPFDEKDGSKEILVLPKSLHTLFSLRENDPDDKEQSLLYAPSPLIGENGVYVVGLQKQIPSQLQSLAQVRDAVVRDYREEKATEFAKDAGEKFASAVQVGLVEGKSFDSVCASENLKPDTLPAFTLNTPSIPEVTNRTEFVQLQETSFNLLTGRSSKFTPTDDGGYVVYVKERLGVDEAKMREELPAYLAKMREQRQIAAFEEWFGHQMQLHLVPPASDRNQPVG